MSEPLLEVRNLGKNYPRINSSSERLAVLWQLLRSNHLKNPVTVLRDINFTVERGRSLAIIGRNGAGKSTLLKLICGVLKPSTGEVFTRAKIGALLELGAGFHPEFSGRENVRLSAALYGLDHRELRQKMAAILDFAELGAYIDEPVKHYSTGMVVRLGFAIVATMRPGLLITDEVLAVGDETFQKKCIAWIEDYLNAGGTLLMVSHSMYHVQKLCSSALWLDEGNMRRYGEVFEVTQAYLAWHADLTRAAEESVRRNPAATYRVKEVELVPDTLDVGETSMVIRGTLISPDDRAPGVAIGLVTEEGQPVYGVTGELSGYTPKRLGAQSFGFDFRFDQPALLPGGFRVRVHAFDPEYLRLHDTVEAALTVRGKCREFGSVRLPGRFE